MMQKNNNLKGKVLDIANKINALKMSKMESENNKQNSDEETKIDHND